MRNHYISHEYLIFDDLEEIGSYHQNKSRLFETCDRSILDITLKITN